MPNYDTKVTFFSSTSVADAYGELITSKGDSFSTGGRVATLSFKENITGGQAIDGTKLWVYVRRNTNTLTVNVGDFVTFPAVSALEYKVIGVDPKLSQRSEILFLVDKVED